jgi:hypothetical protein
MSTPVPDAVKRLVDHFGLGRKVFQSGDYKEERLRPAFQNGPSLSIRDSDLASAAPVGQRGIRTFPGPFFTALGWDMDNKAGLSETFKQVIHKESIKVAGASKAPDYTFRIGGRLSVPDTTNPLRASRLPSLQLWRVKGPA